MKIRLAKAADSAQFAMLHSKARNTTVGFFSKVSVGFLNQYYKCTLSHDDCVALCAVNDQNKIEGFVISTTNARADFLNLKKNSFILGIYLLSSMLKDFRLLFEALDRFRIAVNGNLSNSYVKTDEGARGIYWIWDHSGKNSIWSGTMYNKHLHILYLLGVKNFTIEVDKSNTKALQFALRNGAVITSENKLKDGRIRIIASYNLQFKFVTKRDIFNTNQERLS